MSGQAVYEYAIEAERYELRPARLARFAPDRRQFLKALGGGIAVLLVSSCAQGQEGARQEAGGQRRRAGGEQMPQQIDAWLHVGEDGTITAYTGKVEVGQDVRTSLSQAVAEELRTPVSSIRLVMADTDLTPFDMGTFGSRSTPQMGTQLHRVAAAARVLLAELAADQWKTSASSLEVADGKVLDRSGNRSIGFGELTKGGKLNRAIQGDAPVTPPTVWKICGQAVPKVDARSIVNGTHRYTSDIKRPGMLYGKVLRPEAFGAKLESVDTSKAEAMPGVKIVRDGEFVGVVGSNTHAARQAVAAIQARWKTTPQPAGKEIFDYLKTHPAEERGFGGNSEHTAGSVEDGLKAADSTLRQTYTVAYIAHTPLEPRAAVAEWAGDKLTVWTGTQRPFGVRSELAQAFGIPESSVRVITPDTGSGYGGKHTGECAIEAARLARSAGKPVKLVWTREEEFTWAYFRPAGVIDVSAGAKKDGLLTTWEFHNYNSGPSGIQTMYDAPNQRIAFHPAQSPLRQGSYRALAATANHFARETAMDELAHAIGMEPLEFRLKNLKDPRLIAVYKAAAEALGWDRPKSAADRGRGIAGGFEKGGYVATGAEVTVDKATGRLTVERIVTAMDCGPVVNPNLLKNQIEGAAMMGIGGALFEAIEFADGKILNPHLSQYRVPRFSDMPKIDVVLIDRKDQSPQGAGEIPLMCIAPAIGNAIFDATGIRLRSMPLAPNGVKA